MTNDHTRRANKARADRARGYDAPPPGVTYCGTYPDLDHTACPSSVECTAFCGNAYADAVFCTLARGHEGRHEAPTGDDDGVWSWDDFGPANPTPYAAARDAVAAANGLDDDAPASLVGLTPEQADRADVLADSLAWHVHPGERYGFAADDTAHEFRAEIAWRDARVWYWRADAFGSLLAHGFAPNRRDAKRRATLVFADAFGVGA